MMVTFVSQCEKKAINRTQRILDAFADRIGDRTWQTVITEDGLLAAKRLLRKTVTKNTAVACHWIRSRSRSDLLWIVGNRNKFNPQGIVPVNRTQKELIMDVITMKPKKDQIYANTHLQPLDQHLFAVGYVAEQLFSTIVDNEDYKNLAKVAFLAGCLHDLGKVDPLFQEWVKKGKRKDNHEDGQHIDTKFTFEKHPRHNEISLFLFHLFETQTELTNLQKERLQHLIYWHHAKPYRATNDFTVILKVYEYLSKNLKDEATLITFIQTANQLLQKVASLATQYLGQATILQDLHWNTEQIKQLIDNFVYRFKDTHFPDFKSYSSTDSIANTKQKITLNAYNNVLRACVISADRLVSTLSADDLSDYIEQQRLMEIVEKGQDDISLLTAQLTSASTKFAGSERTQQQNQIAQQLAEKRDIAVLAGPAGCGKTRIALEWARLKQAQKIIWVCPRVQICQGIFQELIENYLPEAKVEIFTGEFKYTQAWDKPTAEKDYFSGDVVVTTIDQILSSITTHTNVNSLLPFMNAHVVFDEYHEYISMEIFNLLFAELVTAKQMRANYQKNVLLVSATPHYLYLQQVLGINQEDVVEMASFNQSHYQIQFVDYDEADRTTNPLLQPYKDNTFIISNTAQTAQLGFIEHQQTENSILFHSKFKRSDKKYWFEQVYQSFCQHGTHKYTVLRSGPIVQASLNISCDNMVSEMTQPENILQRLGRLDRFGENNTVNTLTIAITQDVKKGKSTGKSARFLNNLHALQSAKAWYDFLQQLEGKTFQLSQLYTLYKDFYNNENFSKYVYQDLEKALKSSIQLLTNKVTEPVAISKKSTSTHKKISKHSLRGDNRFVQLAVLDVNNYQKPLFLNQYTYQPPLNDLDEFDNLTEALTLIKDLGLITFMAQKHGNIDITHPVKGIPDKKQTARLMVLENYSRDPEYPLYLSYIEDDLNKVGGTDIRHSEAIYYAICDKQPIGSIAYKQILALKETN